MLTSDSLKDLKIDSSGFGYFGFVLTSTYYELEFVRHLMKHLQKRQKVGFASD